MKDLCKNPNKTIDILHLQSRDKGISNQMYKSRDYKAKD